MLARAYVIGLLAVWAAIRFAGDWIWPATLMLFGPRWIYGAPLPLVAVAVLVVCPRRLPLVAAATIAQVFLIMGFEVPLYRAPHSDDFELRVLTCNLEKQAFDRHALLQLVDDARPDVVALQEYDWQTELEFPHGWHRQESDEFLLFSRYPIVDYALTKRPIGEHRIDTSLVRCVLALPHGPTALYNVHLDTPREGLAAIYDDGPRPSSIARLRQSIHERAAESRADQAWIAQFPQPAIVVGAFNMPVDSAIYRRVWSRYSNAFSVAGLGFGYTKYTGHDWYRYGIRIDHVLYDAHWRCRRCWVGPEIGSDHLPVMADLVLSRPQ